MRCTLLGALAACLSLPAAAEAQAWNDVRTHDLVQLAVARRQQQLADTALRDYRGEARGYLTFLAQMGEGFTEPPRVVKADQLALTVFWLAPSYSKQLIMGRRDTLLMPTDIQYHRDHLGIVQNNFPDIIRLGDGDEVEDVPHPLSLMGLQEYDFAIADSLRISLPGRVIRVLEVKVRPKDDRLARVIGAVYIDRDGGSVVRMAFNFTRAAFKDRQLEDLAIVLENGLVDGRFWLPRRQEIEITRSATWMDMPVRGIIRGRWEIAAYEVNVGLDRSLFVGPEIAQRPQAEQRRFPWPPGRILDSLPPDVRAATDEDIRRVQEEARALVRAQALRRARRPTVAARGVSEFVRVNRVEGLAVGFGVSQPLGSGFTIVARGRYGIDDRRAKGEVTAAWRSEGGWGVRITALDGHAEAGEVQERSGVANTLAAQEFGSDYTDPYGLRSLRVGIELPAEDGVSFRLEVGAEEHRQLRVNAAPAAGRHEPTLYTTPLTGTRVAVRMASSPAVRFGLEVQGSASVSALFVPAGGPVACPSICVIPDVLYAGRTGTKALRASLDLGVERPFGDSRLVLRTVAAGVFAPDGVPPQEVVLFGGPSTAPGYDFHSLAGTVGASQRIEWRRPVAFPAFPLGRFGRVPGAATLAPYAHFVATGVPGGWDDLHTFNLRQASPGTSIRGAGAYPSLGVGLYTFFDLVRLDVARGLNGGRWTFSVDLTRDLWRIL